MKTIVHVITNLGQGGAEKQLTHLLKHHDRAKYKMVVVSLQDEGTLGLELKAHGIQVHALNIKRKRMVWFGLWKLIKIFRELKPDLVQTWLYHANIIGLLAAKYRNNTVVVWNIRCANTLIGSYSWVLVVILKMGALLSRFPDTVIVNSNVGLNAHKALGYRAKKWEFIPNGFDTDIYCPNKQTRSSTRKALNLSESSLIAGLIARFDPLKDCNTFLKAASLVMHKMPNVYFVLVGSGMDWSNPKIVKPIEELQLKEKIFLLGAKSNIEKFLPCLDLLVLSSISEGCPNILGEAMSAGVLCVSTDVGDAAVLVDNAQHIVPPAQALELAKAMERVLMMQETLRFELGLVARKRMLEHFSINKMVSRYESLYDGLFSERTVRSVTND